jgi:hypothetical protein
MRAKEVSDDGRHFKLFFMAWNRTEGRRVFVTARSAELLDGDAGGAAAAIELMLRNGTLSVSTRQESRTSARRNSVKCGFPFP